MEDYEERRECERYLTRDDKSAFVAIRPTFQKIGGLKDISLGGLGFIYALMDGHEPLSQKDYVSVDLFVSGNGFYLSSMQCRLAYDTLDENQSGAITPGIQFRRCGVEFDEPTLAQKEKIQHFLDNYTVGEC